MRNALTPEEKRTYVSWAHMKDRCNNPSFSAAVHYSGKGITYPKAWESFDAFLQDLGSRPEGTSLERRDGNLSYSKDNCYWATRTDQNRNTTRNKMTFETAQEIRKKFNEQDVSMGALAQQYNVGRGVIRSIVRNVCWN